jgi:hypothetical protein
MRNKEHCKLLCAAASFYSVEASYPSVIYQLKLAYLYVLKINGNNLLSLIFFKHKSIHDLLLLNDLNL